MQAAAIGVSIPQLRVPNGPPEQEIAQRASVYRAGQDDMEAMARLPDEVAKVGGLGVLGDTALVVVRRGKPEATFTAEQNAGWVAAQERLAALSSNSVGLIAEKSGHNIQADQPELYAVAVSRVLALRK